MTFFPAGNYVQFSVIKGLNPDPDQHGIQPKMLDPDPYQMNTDPKHCSVQFLFCGYREIVFSQQWSSFIFGCVSFYRSYETEHKSPLFA
jgi:hypothetical protein